MRKLLLSIIFFILTPSILIFSLSLLSYYYQKDHSVSFMQNPKVAYAALPQASASLKATINQKDARITIVANFFNRYKSALAPFADEVIYSADKYGLDYRLIPAIAMQESNLCKKAPKDSYNCWGFGIYGKKVTKFDNYTQAIDIVTKTLANQYKAKGLDTPEKIMSKYTPSSNGSWAFGVNTFMDQLAMNL